MYFFFLFLASSPRIEGEKITSSGQEYQKLIDHSDLHVLEFCKYYNISNIAFIS